MRAIQALHGAAGLAEDPEATRVAIREFQGDVLAPVVPKEVAMEVIARSWIQPVPDSIALTGEEAANQQPPAVDRQGRELGIGEYLYAALQEPARQASRQNLLDQRLCGLHPVI